MRVRVCVQVCVRVCVRVCVHCVRQEQSVDVDEVCWDWDGMDGRSVCGTQHTSSARKGGGYILPPGLLR